MKRIKHIILIILLLSVGFADRQPMKAVTASDSVVDTTVDSFSVKMDSAIRQFVSSRAMTGATVGICVMDLRTGTPVASYNLERQMIPASVMKIVTSSAALKQLTQNFHFRTRLKYTGTIDKNGTLNGDIVIEGGIDPTLDSKHFPDRETFVSAAVENIKLWGIKAIKGNIRPEEKIQPHNAVPKDWLDDDVTEDYGAGVHSINYNDNLFSLIIDTSSGRALVVDTVPHLCSIQIDNRMTVVNRGRFSPVVQRKKNNSRITLSGAMRRMQEPIEVVTTMPHPAVGLCADVRETLESEGIPVEGKKVSASDSDAMQILSYESPVLPEILKSLLFRSDNMYAESVQRKLGESIYGDPKREYGEKAVTKIVEQWGINMDKVTLYDGSGLSRTNRMTPLFLASVLRSAALDWQTGDLFPTLLPRCGVDGTVRNLLKGTCLSGNIALKSGSMTGVRCYAGYYPAERPRYSVVLLTNNFHCTYEQLKSSIERLMVGMFESYQDTIDKRQNTPQL